MPLIGLDPSQLLQGAENRSPVTVNGSEPEAISPLRRRSPGMGVHQEGRQAAREGDYLSPLNVTEGSKTQKFASDRLCCILLQSRHHRAGDAAYRPGPKPAAARRGELIASNRERERTGGDFAAAPSVAGHGCPPRRTTSCA